jgi:hypothetical protein
LIGCPLFKIRQLLVKRLDMQRAKGSGFIGYIIADFILRLRRLGALRKSRG